MKKKENKLGWNTMEYKKKKKFEIFPFCKLVVSI